MLKPGYAKVYYDQNKSVPTFTTGLGKPVVVNQSSLAKASYILRNQDVADTGSFTQSYFSDFSWRI